MWASIWVENHRSRRIPGHCTDTRECKSLQKRVQNAPTGLDYTLQEDCPTTNKTKISPTPVIPKSTPLQRLLQNCICNFRISSFALFIANLFLVSPLSLTCLIHCMTLHQLLCGYIYLPVHFYLALNWKINFFLRFKKYERHFIRYV